MKPKTNEEIMQSWKSDAPTERRAYLMKHQVLELMQLAREAGEAEVKGGCSCGNDAVYLSYCMECLHDLEVEAEQRGYKKAEQDKKTNYGAYDSGWKHGEKAGAQAERERWEKSIVTDEYSETIGCWMVSKAMLRKQGGKI